MLTGRFHFRISVITPSSRSTRETRAFSTADGGTASFGSDASSRASSASLINFCLVIEISRRSFERADAERLTSTRSSSPLEPSAAMCTIMGIDFRRERAVSPEGIIRKNVSCRWSESSAKFAQGNVSTNHPLAHHTVMNLNPVQAADARAGRRSNPINQASEYPPGASRQTRSALCRTLPLPVSAQSSRPPKLRQQCLRS